jgi:hypothetical protein
MSGETTRDLNPHTPAKRRVIMLLRRNPQSESSHWATGWALLSIALTICGCSDDVVGPGALDEWPAGCFDYSLGEPPPVIGILATNYRGCVVEPDHVDLDSSRTGSSGYVDLMNGCSRYQDVLYVVSAHSLAVVDVSRPESPRIVDTHCIPSWPQGHSRCTVSASGPPSSTHEIVCVLDWCSGFWTFDVSSGSACNLLGFTETSVPSHDIVQIGNRVFVATALNGVEVYDISNPVIPRATDTLEAGTAVYDLAAEGTTLYLAAGNNGAFTYEVVDDSLIPGRRTSHPTFLIAAEDGSIFGVSGHSPIGEAASLTKFVAGDGATRDSLVLVSEVPLSGIPRSLSISNGKVYLAEGSMGLEILVDEPGTGVRRIGVCDAALPITNLTVIDDFLYVGGSWQGLRVLPLQCSDAP